MNEYKKIKNNSNFFKTNFDKFNSQSKSINYDNVEYGPYTLEQLGYDNDTYNIYTPVYDQVSNNEHTDFENISISRLRDFTNEFQNICNNESKKTGVDYYKLFCDSINEKGYKLSEITNFQFISKVLHEELEKGNITRAEMNTLLRLYKENFSDYDEATLAKYGDFLNYEVVEIFSDPSGFDAVKRSKHWKLYNRKCMYK